MPDEPSNAIDPMAAEPSASGPATAVAPAEAEARASPESSEPVVEPTQADARTGPQSVDFRAAAPLGAGAQRQLRLRHEDLARSLSTRLSIYLRLETQVKLVYLEPVRCRAWLDRVPSPTHLTLFTLGSYPGLGVLEIPPKLAFIMVDRLLGGTGEPENVARGLSEIERVVANEVVQIFLREWCQNLPIPDQVRLELTGHEDNTRFVQVAADEAPILGLALQVTIKGETQQVQLGIPFSIIEPILPNLFAEPVPAEPCAESPPPKPIWNSQLDQVRIRLTTRCEDFEVSARRLAHLAVGDVLPIESDRLNRVQVRLAKMPKFVGRLGRQGKNRAVELTAPLSK